MLKINLWANYRNIGRCISVSRHFAHLKVSLLFVLDSYTIVPREIIWWIFRITDKDNIIFLEKQSCLFSDFSKPHYLLINLFQNLTTYLEYMIRAKKQIQPVFSQPSLLCRKGLNRNLLTTQRGVALESLSLIFK